MIARVPPFEDTLAYFKYTVSGDITPEVTVAMCENNCCLNLCAQNDNPTEEDYETENPKKLFRQIVTGMN